MLQNKNFLSRWCLRSLWKIFVIEWFHLISRLIRSITKNAMDKKFSIWQFPGPEHPYIAFPQKKTLQYSTFLGSPFAKYGQWMYFYLFIYLSMQLFSSKGGVVAWFQSPMFVCFLRLSASSGCKTKTSQSRKWFSDNLQWFSNDLRCTNTKISKCLPYEDTGNRGGRHKTWTANNIIQLT